MLRPDLCDYNGAYIVVKVKGVITVENTNDASKAIKIWLLRIINKLDTNNNKLDTNVFLPLKYLNNFWRSFNLPLNNCKI